MSFLRQLQFNPLQFSARLKVPLKYEHLQMLHLEKAENPNAKIVTDFFGDTFLMVNTDNGPDKTLSDKEDVLKAVSKMSPYEKLKAEHDAFYQEHIFPLEEELTTLCSNAMKVASRHFRSQIRLYKTTRTKYIPQTPDYTIIREDTLKSPQAIAIQEKINALTHQMQARFLTDLKKREADLNVLNQWVETQFLEYEDLYRDAYDPFN